MSSASGEATRLVSLQNREGGWGYACPTYPAAPPGLSLGQISSGQQCWTEPTALALVALAAVPAPDTSVQDAVSRGRDWLRSHQRADGGWAPTPSVDQSTSVTSVACLALLNDTQFRTPGSALHWLLSEIKPPLTVLERFEYWWQDMPDAETVMGGSPWFPGTAAWVAPTVTAALALAGFRDRFPDLKLDSFVEQARRYLLSRRCRDGGWNHGGTQFRSEEAIGYPEMTGFALLAFDRSPSADLAPSLRLAQTMQSHPGSSEAQCWLHLALTKHRRPSVLNAPLHAPRTVRDLALRVLAENANSPGNALLIQTA